MPANLIPGRTAAGGGEASPGRTGWRRWVFFHIPLLLFIVGLLFPFYWMIVTTVRPDNELYRPWNAANYTPFWTMHPTLEHIRDLLTDEYFAHYRQDPFTPVSEREPVADEVRARVAALPSLSHQGPRIATAVQSGEIGNVIGRLPPQARKAVGLITRAAFTTGLNRILLVAAIIALVSGVISLAAIRGRDFAQQQQPGSPN